MVADNVTDDGKAQSGTMLLCGEIRFEEPGFVFRWNPLTVIGHFDRHDLVVSVAGQMDIHAPFLFDGVDGVVEKIDHHSFQLFPVDNAIDAIEEKGCVDVHPCHEKRSPRPFEFPCKG